MKLYNTLSRKIEDFKPLSNDEVKLYTCGLTVYSQPHIGNWVSYIYWDILVRALRAEGYTVNRVQNITDVGHLTSDEDAGEDKMIKSALKEGMTAWDVAEKYIKIANDEAYEQLGLIKPDHLPRATEYIKQQIDFVAELEQKGYTYTIDDGVYFDTSRLSDYGKLARLDIEGLQFGARVADTGKKNPTDFALWKFSNPKEKRDMEWQSPWGLGFPGWHLECSVMARELLGNQIDIHTGGIDHIPVHHTNEIAQTEALTEKTFSKFWLHANHIKVDGKKMSKSLGNVYTLKDIVDKGYSLDAFKLLVLSKHYRTEGNFTWEILESATNSYETILQAVSLIYQPSPVNETIEDRDFSNTYNSILNKLLNDLDTASALQDLYEISKKIKSTKLSNSSAKSAKNFFEKIDELLGLNLLNNSDINAVSELITALKKAYPKAKETKNFLESDVIKKQIENLGYTVSIEQDGKIIVYAGMSVKMQGSGKIIGDLKTNS